MGSSILCSENQGNRIENIHEILKIQGTVPQKMIHSISFFSIFHLIKIDAIETPDGNRSLAMNIIALHIILSRQQLIKLISSAYPHISIRIIFRSTFRLSNFFRFEDRIPMKLRSCIVYKFQSQRCDALYLGETCRKLHVRISDHMGISAYIGNKISQTGLSCVLTHSKHTGHPISYDDFSILVSGTSQFDVLIGESLLISRLKPSLNKNIRSFPLSLF